jgi:hypothetical protein
MERRFAAILEARSIAFLPQLCPFSYQPTRLNKHQPIPYALTNATKGTGFT